MPDIDGPLPLRSRRVVPASLEDLRRVLGMAMVATAVVGILVVAAIQGRATAGIASAPPIASVPQIGDCVTADVSDRSGILEEWSPVLPSVGIESCTGSRFGEVTVVVQDFTARSPGISAPGPYSQCVRKTDEYLGIPSRLSTYAGANAAASTGVPVFLPATRVSTAYYGPDARARAAGQTWGACVVYIAVSAHSTAPVTVDHSLRDMWRNNVDSRLLAMCLDRPDAIDPLPCQLPHAFELISISTGTPFASTESIAAACRESAVAVLGSSKSIDSGVLTAQVVAVRPGEVLDGSMMSGPAAVSTVIPYVNNCLLTPNDQSRTLTASLRGLGDSTVPLN